jgi:hypothetical protein
MSLSTVDKSLCPVPGIRDLPRSPHLWRRGASSCLSQQLINLCAQYLLYRGLTPEPSPVEAWGCSSCLFPRLINLCAQYLVYGTYPGALTCGGVGLVSVSILLISGRQLWVAGRHRCRTPSIVPTKSCTLPEHAAGPESKV